MAIHHDLKTVNRVIDKLLRERRPDRYTVRGTDLDEEQETPDADTTPQEEEPDWLDDVADTVAPLIPGELLRKRFARNLVGQREGQATNRANKFLRRIFTEGQAPLDWMDMKDDPIAIVTRSQKQGKRPVVTEERVALRSMTPRDFRAFAAEERRRAAGEFATRNQTCDAADWIADQMVEAKSKNFEAWASPEPQTP